MWPSLFGHPFKCQSADCEDACKRDAEGKGKFASSKWRSSFKLQRRTQRILMDCQPKANDREDTVEIFNTSLLIIY